DDACDAAALPVVLQLRGTDLPRELRRQLVEQRSDAAHLLHLRDLCLEILQVEAPAPLQLFGDALRLVEVDPGVRLLDQPEDVAHAEDPCRHALGGERLEAAEHLATAPELDRLAGDPSYGVYTPPAARRVPAAVV